MSDVVRKFHRAAGQRLESAEILYRDHGRVVDGMYLGGYCIECSLKSIILSRVPRNKQAEYVDAEFRGKVAHDFGYLMDRWSNLGGAPFPKDILRGVRTGRLIWSPDLRYETGLGGQREEDVSALLTFARVLWNWVGEHI